MPSDNQLTKQSEEKSVSGGSSKTVVKQLIGLMEEVTKKEVTPNAVNAACNCAKQIKDLLRLEFEMLKWKGK